MLKLYLYNGRKIINYKNAEPIYVYVTDSGRLEGPLVTSLNDSARLNEIAESLRDSYSEYIFALNQDFVEAGWVHEELSLFFVTDLSGKRIDIHPTFPRICHLKLLQEKLVGLPTRIILHGFDNRMRALVASQWPNAFIEIIDERKPNCIGRLAWWARQAKFFGQFLGKLFVLHSFTNPPRPAEETVFLSRYPAHFDSQFREDKYGDMIDRYGTYCYLISIATDGLHQNQTVKEFKKQVRELREIGSNFFVIDKLVTTGDLALGLFACVAAFRQLLLFERRLLPKFAGLDISRHLADELSISTLRVPRLLIYEHGLRTFFKAHAPKRFIYYLHEYAYGRYFTYLLRRHFPQVETIGLQHGPITKRKVNFYLAKSEPARDESDFRLKLPMPHRVWAEDFESKVIYEEAGYDHVEVLEPLPRLAYLSKVDRRNILPNTVLVACGLHDGIPLLRSVISDLYRHPEKKFLFKPHPRGKTKELVREFEAVKCTNLELVEGHITEYLSTVNEVICTYSSVAFEAYSLEIRTYLFDVPGKINESPLYDIAKSGTNTLVSFYTPDQSTQPGRECNAAKERPLRCNSRSSS